LVGPGLKGLFKWPPHKLSDGTEHTEHTVEIIRNQITQGGGAMAPMGDMLSAEDLDNLIAYLQTL
jgi:mono/diheme cytochrome c family protein